jgi:hypothetical protein
MAWPGYPVKERRAWLRPVSPPGALVSLACSNNEIMKAIPSFSPSRAGHGLAVAALLALTATAALAQKAQIIPRPLTPADRTAYGLATTNQLSGGLTTIGVGTAAYLDAVVLKSSSVSKIVWAVTSRPAGSTAVLAPSPLTTNVPLYEPSDQLAYTIAGRQFLVPDVKGQYTITATVTSGTNTIALTNVITAANYVGVGNVDGAAPTNNRQCVQCHDGGLTPDKVTPWSKSAHGKAFTLGIDGLSSSHFSSNCLSCHVLGYNTALTATNGGFDDVAAQLNWKFPAVLTNGNWAALPNALKQVSNIQCESCHGPGSEHGGNKAKISVSFTAGTCGQCHASGSNHIRAQEWLNSMHAETPREESSSCAGCHSGMGFIDRLEGAATVRTNYAAITCVTCHDPHDGSNPSQLRTVSKVTLLDTSKAGGATVITSGGKGMICMECHMSRRDAVTYVNTTTGNNRFGPHHGPQADMLMGVNAITYGLTIPSSGHSTVISDSCVTCHMQTLASTNSAFLHAGGHTFSMAYDTATNSVELVAACQSCHGKTVTSFDIARVDYDGNGVVEGIQTEVKGLAKQLSMLLPPLGQPKLTVTDVGNAITTNYTKAQLSAVYNLLFALEDGSYGVHNTAYAVGILKASIANLSSGGTTGAPTVAQVNSTLASYFAQSTTYATSPAVLGNGYFQLSVTNLVGWNLGVQVSSDLKSWTNLPTAAMPAYQFYDPDAGKTAQRYYRLRYP